MTINNQPDPCGPGKLFAPTRSINVRTPIPGPKSQAILARRASAVGQGLRQRTPLVVARAHGCLITDVDGNTFIDFTSGLNTLTVGHTPYHVVEALQTQAETLIHIGETLATTELYVRVCELLNELTPPMRGAKKSILSNTHVEALENAIRTARAFTSRQVILTADQLASKLDMSFNPQTAAVIIEPVNAYRLLPVPLVQDLANCCRKTGMLLIVDETLTGFGRTGKLFAIEHFDVQPDLIISGQSIGVGMPLSAVTGRAEVIDAVPVGGFESIFGGNPLSCATALQTIALIRDQNFSHRAQQIEELVRERVADWQEEIPEINGLRGVGAVLALELSAGSADHILTEALHNGLLLPDAEQDQHLIPLAFPLMIPEEQLNEGLDVLEHVLYQVSHQASEP